jgi:hypothetical protein
VHEAAFNGKFIEGQTQTYTLEDTSEGVFELFVQWMYFQQLRSKLLEGLGAYTQPYRQNWTFVETAESESRVLIRLWNLAQKLIPSLRNDVIDTLIKLGDSTEYLQCTANTELYESTEPGSLLRKFFINLYAIRVLPETIVREKKHFPKEMFLDILVELGTILRNGSILCDANGKAQHPLFSTSNYYVQVEDWARN